MCVRGVRVEERLWEVFCALSGWGQSFDNRMSLIDELRRRNKAGDGRSCVSERDMRGHSGTFVYNSRQVSVSTYSQLNTSLFIHLPARDLFTVTAHR